LDDWAKMAIQEAKRVLAQNQACETRSSKERQGTDKKAYEIQARVEIQLEMYEGDWLYLSLYIGILAICEIKARTEIQRKLEMYEGG
jgi:hypothetical protein